VSRTTVTNQVPMGLYKADLETSYKKFQRVIHDPLWKSAFIIIVSAISIIFPLLFPVSFLMVLWAFMQRPTLEFPARAPFDSRLIDNTDPKPSGTGFYRARGEVYIGRHRITKKECWLSWSDMLTHIYCLGATGSGKTETIWAIYMNFLCAGSSFSLGDGKGTLEFIRQGAIAARRFGVEDEYFVINYATEKSNVNNTLNKILTHKINPFSEGSAANLKELFASISLSGDAGQNQFFEDGASNILERVFPALVELRDLGIIDLNMEIIGRSFTLDGMYRLYKNEAISPESRSFLKNHLEYVSFDFRKAEEGGLQDPELIKQHGQFISHFVKVVASFSVQYRGIFMVDLGDVSIKDILRNRRILIFTLPSLEKSGSELKMLGKILITSQRNGCSNELGDELEGTREEVISKLSGSHTIPYGLAYDEWAFYSIEGMAMLPAQIRGIKFSGGFFAQDYAGTTGAGEKDAEQIFANTRVKLFGSIEETGQTWVKFRDLIGEIKQAYHTSYKNKDGMLGDKRIVDRDSVEIRSQAEIEIKEAQAQVEGEFYLAIRGRVSPIDVYYTGLGDLDKENKIPFKMNRFLRVYPPSEDTNTLILKEAKFLDILFSKNKIFTKENPILKPIKNTLNGDAKKCLTQDNHNDRYLSALNKFVSVSSMSMTSFASSPKIEKEIFIAETPEINDPLFNENESLELSDIVEETIHIDDHNDQVASDILGSFSIKEDEDIESENYTKAESYIKRQNHVIIDTSSVDNTNRSEPLYASLLSDNEADMIKKHTENVLVLLGASASEASKSADKTIHQINNISFYIPPPKPSAPDAGQIRIIGDRVDSLLEEDH
jgi:hypothetical protein